MVPDDQRLRSVAERCDARGRSSAVRVRDHDQIYPQ